MSLLEAISVNSKPRKPPPKVFNSANIAFVVVVCTTYASAAPWFIYTRRSLPAWEVAVLVAAGAAYLVVGTYGFTFCRRSESWLAVAAYFAIQLLLASTLILLRGSVRQPALILPLVGQSALLLPMRGIVAVCILIYVTLVVPSILRFPWLETIEHALIYGTGIVFVVVFTRIAASERDARTQLAEANKHLRRKDWRTCGTQLPPCAPLRLKAARYLRRWLIWSNNGMLPRYAQSLQLRAHRAR